MKQLAILLLFLPDIAWAQIPVTDNALNIARAVLIATLIFFAVAGYVIAKIELF